MTGKVLQYANAPEFVFPAFLKFIKDSVLVAHNAWFDIGFLRREFERLQIPLNNQWICTMEMSRKRFPELSNHKLQTVYQHMVGSKSTLTPNHRALNGAKMAAAIWVAIKNPISQYGKE
jgi:DNA polymerase-3 subunit epsilon